MFRAPRPPWPLALVAGILGTVAGAPVAHRISGTHEFHAFQPESFIAGLSGALILLMVIRFVKRRVGPSEPRLFR